MCSVNYSPAEPVLSDCLSTGLLSLQPPTCTEDIGMYPHKSSQRPHKDFTKTTQRLHKDLTKTTQRPHKYLTKTSQRPHKDLTKTTQRPHKDLTKNTQRPHKDLRNSSQPFSFVLSTRRHAHCINFNLLLIRNKMDAQE